MQHFKHGFSYGSIQDFLKAWESESQFLTGDPAEITSKVSNLLKAHKQLYDTAMAVCHDAQVPLAQVKWPANAMSAERLSVNVAILKRTREWLSEHFDIPIEATKVRSICYSQASMHLTC